MTDSRGRRISYRPGGWVAVAGDRLCLLAQVGLGAEVVGRLDDAVGSRAGLDAVLEVIASEGLRSVPSFAAAELVSEDRLRVVARGEGVVELMGEGPEILVSAPRGLWADRTEPAAAAVLRSADGRTDGPDLPLGAGVVPASWVRIAHESRDQFAPVSPVPQAVEVPVGSEPDESSYPTRDRGSAAAGVAADGPSPVRPAPLEAAAEPGAIQPTEEEPASATPGPDPGGVVPSAAPLTDDVADPTADQPGADYDELFLHTSLQRPPVPPPDPAASAPLGMPAEQLVVPSAPTPASAAPLGLTLLPDDLDSGPEAAAALPIGVVAPPAAPAGIIDSVPGYDDFVTPPQPASPPVSVAPAPAPSPVHPAVIPPAHPVPPAQPAPNVTVNRSQLLARAGGPPGAAPEVQAARCGAGHLSPAHAEVCRVCGLPMPLPPNPFWIQRPVLGRLVFSNGHQVTLDRSLILGRAPSVPAGHTGEEPNLVRLGDPTNEISSQHLEVRLDHWYVLAVDLGSTNGTEVTLPGQKPTRLRPGTPQPLEPGATVNLADVLSFTFEVVA